MIKNSAFLGVAVVLSLSWASSSWAVSGLSLGSAPAADQPQVVSDELFVRWRDVPEATRESVYRKYGAQRVWASELISGLELIRFDAHLDSLGTALYTNWQALGQEPGVMYSEPNYVQKRKLEPHPSQEIPPADFSILSIINANDPHLKDQWALVGKNGMHVTEVWSKMGDLKLVRVGVIDTGIDATHPDLQGKVLPGYDFIDETNVVRDVGGHGSHVAGIISAVINNGIGVAGVAPNVELLPIRAVPDEGDETDLHVIRSVEYAVLNGASIINCSFGKQVESQAVAEAYLAAGEKGVLAVAAAGNDGENLEQHPSYPAAFHTPNMLVVGALSSRGAPAYFSNYSTKLVDVFAPGAAILSTIPNNQYASYDGTSMATPEAVGIAALLRGMRPDLNAYQVRDMMRENVRKIDVLTDMAVSGGTLDAPILLDKASGL